MAYARASTACGGTVAPRARHWNAVKFKADDAIRDGSAKIASDLIASARKPSTAIEGDADEVIYFRIG